VLTILESADPNVFVSLTQTVVYVRASETPVRTGCIDTRIEWGCVLMVPLQINFYFLVLHILAWGTIAFVVGLLFGVGLRLAFGWNLTP